MGSKEGERWRAMESMASMEGEGERRRRWSAMVAMEGEKHRSDRVPDPISPIPLPHHFIQLLTLPCLCPPRRIKFTIIMRSNFGSAAIVRPQPFCVEVSR